METITRIKTLENLTSKFDDYLSDDADKIFKLQEQVDLLWLAVKKLQQLVIDQTVINQGFIEILQK